jgi:WD40 repeat protein/serine/threonine protein kinase
MEMKCPTEQELGRLLEPDFDPDAAERIGAHLDTCDRCRIRLDQIANASWEMVAPTAREGANDVEESGGGSVLRRAMAGLIEKDRSPITTSLAVSDLSGKLFGEFEILDEIAKGGMGIVYRARQQNLNRLVALKLLGTGAVVSQDRVARFRTETEAVATIEHPNIVPIYSVGEVDGQPYFSMKLIEGGSLAQRLEELTPGSVLKSSLSNRSDIQSRQHQIVAIMISICRAIHYTHERGILHRDLKPNNILMDEHGEPQITDFGLAKILENDSGLTESFAVMGTPSYMAPEQATGHSRQITTAADIYGLGAIFYELLCGVPPFKEATPLATMRRVIDSEPDSPRKLCSMIDPDLETVCLKALNKEPDRRYDSALKMAEDLERWRDGEPVLARPIGILEKSWRWGRRNPLSTGLVGLVGLLVCLIVFGVVRFGVKVSELLRESESLVMDFQLGEAEDLLSKGDSMTGIALLGHVLENNPNHEVAASRLVSALVHRDLAIPQGAPRDHGVAVIDIQLSPDHRHMASLGIDGSVVLWSIDDDGSKVPRLVVSPQRVRSIAFESNGDRLIGGCFSGDILVWDVATGGILGVRQIHDSSVDVLAVGMGRSAVVSGSSDQSVRVWNMDSGESLSEPLVHPRRILTLDLNRAGDRVLTSCENGMVRIWEVGSGELVAGPFRHFGPLRGAQFDPLERRVITYGVGPRAIIWDVKENRPVTMNIEHKAPITRAEFNPDGRTLVTVGEDGFARVWDAVSGKLLRETSTKKTRIEEMCFGPLGKKLLLVGSGGVCQLWDAECERMLVNEMRHPDRVNAAVFTRDGRAIVTACEDGLVRKWNIGRLPPWKTIIRHEGPVNDAEFTSHGRSLVTAGQDGFLKVTDPSTGLGRFRRVRAGFSIGFISVADTSDRILAGEVSLRRPALAGLWDGMTGKALVEPIRQSGNLRCGDFSPDGSRIVLGSERGAVTVWKANNDLEPLLRYDHIGPINSVTFDHSGTRVVSAGNDGKAIVSAIKGSEKPEGTVSHGGRILVAVFHPNDEILLTASSGHSARLWKLSEGLGVPVGSSFAHEDSVNWAEFSPDGLSVLTASGDGMVSVWSVLDQSRLGAPIQHSGPVLRAHFDNAGKRVVLIGGDHIARVWDLESRRPVSEPMEHSRELFDGAFSPDDLTVMTNAADDAARIWTIPSPPLPFPLWFTKFLGCITGVTVDSKGTRSVLEEERVTDIRREVSQLGTEGYYEGLASWLLEMGEARTMGPHSTKLLSQYIEGEVAFGSFTSINEALKYSPTNGEALGRHAMLLIRDVGQKVKSRREAGFYSRRAVELSPESPELWAIRAEVMRVSGRLEAEWEAMDRYLELTGQPLQTNETDRTVRSVEE